MGKDLFFDETWELYVLKSAGNLCIGQPFLIVFTCSPSWIPFPILSGKRFLFRNFSQIHVPERAFTHPDGNSRTLNMIHVLERFFTYPGAIVSARVFLSMQAMERTMNFINLVSTHLPFQACSNSLGHATEAESANFGLNICASFT